MKYLESSFTVPVGQHKLSDAEYQLRVGAITQAQFDEAVKQHDGVVVYDKESKSC